MINEDGLGRVICGFGTKSSVVKSTTYEDEISLTGWIRNRRTMNSLIENRGVASAMEEKPEYFDCNTSTTMYGNHILVVFKEHVVLH